MKPPTSSAEFTLKFAFHAKTKCFKTILRCIYFSTSFKRNKRRINVLIRTVINIIQNASLLHFRFFWSKSQKYLKKEDTDCILSMFRKVLAVKTCLLFQTRVSSKFQLRRALFMSTAEAVDNLIKHYCCIQVEQHRILVTNKSTIDAIAGFG